MKGLAPALVVCTAVVCGVFGDVGVGVAWALWVLTIVAFMAMVAALAAPSETSERRRTYDLSRRGD